MGGPLHFECAVIKFYFWKRTALDVDFPLRNVRQRGDSRSRILVQGQSHVRAVISHAHVQFPCRAATIAPPSPDFGNFRFYKAQISFSIELVLNI